MGAACGKSTKRKEHRQKAYIDENANKNTGSQSNNPNALPTEKASNPAPTINNDVPSPYRNHANVQRDGFDSNFLFDRRGGDDYLKSSFANQPYNQGDMDYPNKFQSQNRNSLQNLDQAQKGQLKPIYNEPLDKPRIPSQGYQYYDSRGNFQGGDDNVYDPATAFFDSKDADEDYYLDLDEKLVREYEEFLVKARLSGSKTTRQQSFGNNKSHSHWMEWSNLIQKQLNQERSTMSATDNINKLIKAYKSLLLQDERYWYEEMVTLYKEGMLKTNSTMTGLIDRKIIQLQEQFKWLISAIANLRLNPNTTIGVHDFPPFRIGKKKDKLDSSSVISGARGQGSATGSDDMTDLFSPLRSQNINQMSLGRNPTSGGFIQETRDPRQAYYSDFPELFSPAWQQGFIWKGVYLKLFSKNDAQSLKKELKVLKHLGIEYLQTETTVKIADFTHSFSLNPNESMEGHNKLTGNQTLSALMPLIYTVESSSWVLLGTPMLPVKRSFSDEYTNRVANEVHNMFKKSSLLSNISLKNFKMYHRLEENQTSHTFGNIERGANHPANQGSNASFLLLSNVGKVMTTLPKVHLMMIISQEANSAISFLDYPSRGLDARLIQKALGYANEDINTEALFPGKRRSQSYNELSFQSIKFKRGGWKMQMIHVVPQMKSLPPTFGMNIRAMDLLSHSQKKRRIEIRGNVLVFGCFSNSNSIVHPYFISEQTITSSFFEEGPGMGNPRQYLPSQMIDGGSFVGKDSFLKTSFKVDPRMERIEKAQREEKAIFESFFNNIPKSIQTIIDQLDNTDSIQNFAGLKELFHRKGVNMRFEWIVWTKLRTQRAQVLVGADIVARCLKRMMNDKTSKKFSSFKKEAQASQMESSTQRKRMDDVVQQKSEFYLEDYFKKVLCQYLNILIRDSVETTDFEADDNVYQELSTDLFLHRIRLLDFAKKWFDLKTFDQYLSSETLKTLMNIPCLHANTFIDAVSYHMNICFNFDIIRQIRNDKYMNWMTAHGVFFKTTDLNVIYANNSHLTTYERCYIHLLKFLPNAQSPSSNSIELILPSSLYKMQKKSRFDDPSQKSYLREYYEIPDLEIFNDWVIVLEGALNNLYTPDGQQNLLIEAYVIQMVLAYFGEGDSDNQLSLSILEKINNLVNNSPVTTPEMTITIQTWYGILTESKRFSDGEQSYTIALLILHKLYGDPRGRGAKGTPWELFISWRLSILSRLQEKTHDAEYVEELYDATALTLKDNPMNSHLKSHYIYTDPIQAFRSPSISDSYGQNEKFHLSSKLSIKNLKIEDHPFSYWANHLLFDEGTSKMETLNDTLQKTPQLLKWIIAYMPIFQSTGILWDTYYIKEFFFSIMQSSFSNTTSVSSVSGNSINNRSSIGGGIDPLNTSQGLRSSNSSIRNEKKEKKFNPGGNLVQTFERDSSTFNKREINGTIYSWGQNDKGQTGSMLGNVEDLGGLGKKKSRIYYPKRLITLKDTIIGSVSCGHSHSMAITLNGQVLAWGDNTHSQLGLGPKAPTEVFVPTLIASLRDVISVSCGNEHTVSLTKSGVYSWGNGEDGLLGHGDIYKQNLPKLIEALRNVNVQSVVCGGLHTLALTKDGSIYSWGKGEGGQLGHPIDQLTKILSENRLYLTTPRKIRTVFARPIVQLACGDAHSLALTENGLVYAWGFSNFGQLGLGITSESQEMNQNFQIMEPVLVEKLQGIRITDIYAGALFSLFLSDKKELYACGLNESNQLGIEKVIQKINTQMDRYGTLKTHECSVPAKLECFTGIPILQVACGEAHSIALAYWDKSYILFTWGMQKHGQLGLGDMQIPTSTPRAITFLQYVMAYSMSCGAYHCMVVLGEPNKTFKKDAVMERLERKPINKWSSIFFELGGSYETAIEAALNNLDNIIPSEEGKIDNPKAIRKGYPM